MKRVYYTICLIAMVLMLFAILTATVSADNKEYELVWEETFDVPGFINTDIWTIAPFTHGPTASNHVFHPDNVKIEGGNLSITTKYSKEGFWYPTGAVDNNGQPVYKGGQFATGNVNTYGKFAYLYGKLEVRAKVVDTPGAWSNFWLMPENRRWPPEIDVFEIYGREPNKVTHHVHYGAARAQNGERSQSNSAGSYTLSESAGKDFHVYTIEWTPNELIWYVDGNMSKKMTNPSIIPQLPMSIILDSSIVENHINEDTSWPQDYLIDYVKFYQHKNPKGVVFDEYDGSFAKTHSNTSNLRFYNNSLLMLTEAGKNTRESIIYHVPNVEQFNLGVMFSSRNSYNFNFTIDNYKATLDPKFYAAPNENGPWTEVIPQKEIAWIADYESKFLPTGTEYIKIEFPAAGDDYSCLGFDALSFVHAAVLEAEDAKLSGGASIENKYVKGLNTAGSGVAFDYTLYDDGVYDIVINYASAEPVNNLGLYINSVKVRDIQFDASGGLNTWTKQIEGVSLAAGDAEIKLMAETASSNQINIDSISLFLKEKKSIGKNLALEKKASVSAHYGTNDGSRTIDGNESTVWNSPYKDDPNGNDFISNNGAWLEIDFDEPTAFNKTVIKSYDKSVLVKEYAIQYWNGAEWADIFKGGNIEPVHTDVFEMVVSNKVRFFVSKLSGGESPWIYEFEVYYSPDEGSLYNVNIDQVRLSGNNKIFATLTVNNDSSMDRNKILLIGLYDEKNKLIDVKMESLSLGKKSGITITRDFMAEVGTGYKVKGFLWDKIDSQHPEAVVGVWVIVPENNIVIDAVTVNGDNVVTITGYSYGEGKAVTLKVLGDEVPVYFDQTISGENGKFVFTYVLSENSESISDYLAIVGGENINPESKSEKIFTR